MTKLDLEALKEKARTLRRHIIAPLFFLISSAIVGPSFAQDGPIPFQLLKGEDRQKVREVVDHASLYREVKGVPFKSRRGVYEYFLDHPDFGASVARALGLAKYRVIKEGDGRYFMDDARGVKGHFQVLYADPKKRVFFAQGIYEKKLMPRIVGRMVIVLEFEHHLDGGGQSYVEHRLYGYLRVDNFLIDLAMRVIRPFVGGTLDRKTGRTLRVAREVINQAYDDFDAFYRRLEESPEIPQDQLQDFRRAVISNRAP